MAQGIHQSNSHSSAQRKTLPIRILAKRIEDDIRDRGLQPGDVYFSTAETARMLQTGTAMANRALQLLEQRQILIRSQRRGALVASPTVMPPLSHCRVNVIMEMYNSQDPRHVTNGLLPGIQKALPDCNLKQLFLPITDKPEHVRQIIDEILLSPQRQGVVLIRPSLTTQQQVTDSGLPAVIYGTPYPSMTPIPWVDADWEQAAYLMANQMLRRGCRCFAILLKQQVLREDNLLLQAFERCLVQAKHPVNLTVRCLPAETEVIHYEITDLLNRFYVRYQNVEGPTASRRQQRVVWNSLLFKGARAGSGVCGESHRERRTPTKD